MSVNPVDSVLKLYSVWSEGFSVTGSSSGAVLHGRVGAYSFNEACDKLAVTKPEFGAYYNSTRLTYWGCRLFESESDARKSYG